MSKCSVFLLPFLSSVFFFTFVQGVSKTQVLSQLHQVKEHKCHCTALFIRELQAILHLDRAVSGLTKEFLGS